MKILIFATVLALLSLHISCETPETTPETTPEPVSAPEASEGAPQAPPQIDMAQMEQMTKMMQMLSGMQCLMSVDKFLRNKSKDIQNIKDKEHAQTRLNRLVVKLYKTCKSDGGMDNIADMLDPKKADENASKDLSDLEEKKPKTPEEMYEDIDVVEILNDDTPELTEEEQKVWQEFKDVEEEMGKYQKEAKKKQDEERRKKNKERREKNKNKKKRIPKKKKKAPVKSSYWGLVSITVIALILSVLLSKLFKEEEVKPKRKKGKKNKKKN